MRLELFSDDGTLVHTSVPSNIDKIVQDNPVILFAGKHYVYSDSNGDEWIAYSEADLIEIKRPEAGNNDTAIYGKEIG